MKRWKVQHAFCLSPGRDVHPGAILTPTDITEARAKQKVNEGFIVEIPYLESQTPGAAVKRPVSPMTPGWGRGVTEAGGALGGPGGPSGAPSGLDPNPSGGGTAEPGGAGSLGDGSAETSTPGAADNDTEKHPNEGGGLTHRDPGPATNHAGDGADSAPEAGGKNPAAKTAAGKGK